MKKVSVISSLISSGSYQDMVEKVFELSDQLPSSYVCVSNVHMVIEAYNNKEFNQILNQADLATPDGKPLAIAMSLLYKKHQPRVAGMDLLPDLLQESAMRGKSVYFYGGTQSTLDLIEKRVKSELPNLTVAGLYSPPFRKLSDQEEEDIINMINNSGADLLFVSLGCPKAEYWMARHKGKINCCMLGVGGAFPVYAGTQKRAPRWMQNLALEWLYRLVLEPKRLWKRYLTTNSQFLYLFISQYIKNIFSSRPVEHA